VEARDSLLATVLAPDVRMARLTATGTGMAGRVYWERSRGMVVLTASALPPAPSGRTYQLWGIPTGGTPRSLGTFDVDSAGRVRMMVPMPAGAAMDVAAITEEPSGGSPQPTSQPILVGTLGTE
jgi:anti-sigma-K factor RskA